MNVQQDLFHHVRENPDDAKSREFEIQNRKYIGSKYRLLPFITQTISDRAGTIKTFFDVFAGTGVVAHAFADRAETVIANDLLYSNYVANTAFLQSSRENVDMDNIVRLLDELNQSEPEEGYVWEHFGGSYFSYENAGLIDAIREKIEIVFNRGRCTLQEKYILLTSLLYAIDKAANTVGQYDAFLKHLGKKSYSHTGSHLVDSNVYKRIVLKPLLLSFRGNARVHNEDANTLIRKIKVDVLYLDPPYNTRQYIDNYHLLENIIQWKKPAVFGKTKKFERTSLKSRYSRKHEAAMALRELVMQTDAGHIFLSYNNEGIIPEETIRGIMSERGRVECVERDYSIFGNGAGVSGKRRIKEKLFYCKTSLRYKPGRKGNPETGGKRS
ncbi:MAG: DNA adenine methylase [Spirochaetales bacterium]|nr:DNA adenine methylase [Spirochaetales bacterium]